MSIQRLSIKRYPSATPSEQRGVALVMAMLIVSLIAVIAVEISWRFDLSIARSGNRWHGMQARAYLEGAETLSKVVLQQDGKDAPESDNKSEIWAQPPTPFPTDEGWVQGAIEDAEGRFNINYLALDTEKIKPNKQGCERYGPNQERFIRMLQTINLNPDEESDDKEYLALADAEAITEAVIDWLDADSEVLGFGGAESDYYGQLEPPLTIANRPMVSITELRIIKGVSSVLYERLLPHVIALESEKTTGININTASLSVIRSITINEPRCELVPMSEDAGLEIFNAISGGAFTSWDDFKGNPEIQTHLTDAEGNLKIDQAQLGFTSNNFLLFAESMVGEHIRRSKSLLYRDREDEFRVTTLRRTDANF